MNKRYHKPPINEYGNANRLSAHSLLGSESIPNLGNAMSMQTRKMRMLVNLTCGEEANSKIPMFRSWDSSGVRELGSTSQEPPVCNVRLHTVSRSTKLVERSHLPADTIQIILVIGLYNCTPIPCSGPRYRTHLQKCHE